MRIFQITDTHLFGSKNEQLRDINTFDSFSTVIDHVQGYLQPTDILIFSGDLTQFGESEAYQNFKDHIKYLNSEQVAFLPGNHDNIAVMQSVLQAPNFIHTPGYLELDHWVIALVDSTIPGEIHGQLNKEQINTLQQYNQMAAASKKSLMIVMHHHLLETQGYMDRYITENYEVATSRLLKLTQLKIVTCGHIHQYFEQQKQHVVFFAAPSTCYQILPHAQKSTLDPVDPGYLVFELGPQGEFNVKMVRVPLTS